LVLQNNGQIPALPAELVPAVTPTTMPATPGATAEVPAAGSVSTEDAAAIKSMLTSLMQATINADADAMKAAIYTTPAQADIVDTAVALVQSLKKLQDAATAKYGDAA